MSQPFFMLPERYRELQFGQDSKLTKEEVEQGWHFCYDWDFLLVGPGTPEEAACVCELNRRKYNEQSTNI